MQTNAFGFPQTTMLVGLCRRKFGRNGSNTARPKRKSDREAAQCEITGKKRLLDREKGPKDRLLSHPVRQARFYICLRMPQENTPTMMNTLSAMYDLTADLPSHQPTPITSCSLKPGPLAKQYSIICWHSSVGIATIFFAEIQTINFAKNVKTNRLQRSHVFLHQTHFESIFACHQCDEPALGGILHSAFPCDTKSKEEKSGGKKERTLLHKAEFFPKRLCLMHSFLQPCLHYHVFRNQGF